MRVVLLAVTLALLVLAPGYTTRPSTHPRPVAGDGVWTQPVALAVTYSGDPVVARFIGRPATLQEYALQQYTGTRIGERLTTPDLTQLFMPPS